MNHADLVHKQLRIYTSHRYSAAQAQASPIFVHVLSSVFGLHHLLRENVCLFSCRALCCFHQLGTNFDIWRQVGSAAG